MENEKIRFGVLGTGKIGKIHIENLMNRIRGAEVVAISDVSLDELATTEARYNIAYSFLDYRRVLDLPDVDAVAICTTAETHDQMILDAANAGKHIFCELQAHPSIEKLGEIAETVERKRVKLMVGFNRRFDPDFRKVHESVAGGKIGEPLILKITNRDASPSPGEDTHASGGLFLDMTIHDFDLARYLVGSNIVEIYARLNVLAEQAGDEGTAILSLRFENGAMGEIDDSRKAAYGCDQRVEVFGSEGMDKVENTPADSHVFVDHTGTHSAPPVDSVMGRYAESYLSEMSAFVEALRCDKPVPVSISDGLMAVAAGLAAVRSVKENRPVKLSEVYDRRASPCATS